MHQAQNNWERQDNYETRGDNIHASICDSECSKVDTGCSNDLGIPARSDRLALEDRDNSASGIVGADDENEDVVESLRNRGDQGDRIFEQVKVHKAYRQLDQSFRGFEEDLIQPEQLKSRLVC